MTLLLQLVNRINWQNNCSYEITGITLSPNLYEELKNEVIQKLAIEITTEYSTINGIEFVVDPRLDGLKYEFYYEKQSFNFAKKFISIENRSWSEDYSHENRNYMNKCIRCKEDFKGHKRRVICKICSTK